MWNLLHLSWTTSDLRDIRFKQMAHSTSFPTSRHFNTWEFFYTNDSGALGYMPKNSFNLSICYSCLNVNGSNHLPYRIIATFRKALQSMYPVLDLLTIVMSNPNAMITLSRICDSNNYLAHPFRPYPKMHTLIIVTAIL